MMSAEQLTVEVHRLRALDRERRRISEQVESDLRKLRAKAHGIERGLEQISLRLRYTMQHGVSRTELEDILASYEEYRSQLKQL